MVHTTTIPIYYWNDVVKFFNLTEDEFFELGYDREQELTSKFMDIHDCAYYGAEKQDFFPEIYAERICKEKGKTALFAENFS